MARKVDWNTRAWNEGLRQAIIRQVERGETTYGRIAVFSGYVNMRGGTEHPDPTALKRALGILPRKERGKEFTSITLPEEKAMLIMHALNLDPVDVGF